MTPRKSEDFAHNGPQYNGVGLPEGPLCHRAATIVSRQPLNHAPAHGGIDSCRDGLGDRAFRTAECCVSCTETYRLVWRARPKSPDASVGIPTELSDAQNSGLLPRSYGRRPRQPPRLRVSRTQASAPLNVGCQERSRRPTKSSRRSCTKRSNEIEFSSRGGGEGPACSSSAVHPKGCGGLGSGRAQQIAVAGVESGPRETFAASALDRPRSRSRLLLGTWQLAGAGCNPLPATGYSRLASAHVHRSEKGSLRLVAGNTHSPFKAAACAHLFARAA